MRVVEIEMNTLYKKIILGVRTIFEQAQARWEATLSIVLSELCADFRIWLNEFDQWVID